MMSQQTVMSQMDDEKWAVLLENSLTRKEEQKVLIISDKKDNDSDHGNDDIIINFKQISEEEICRIFKEIDKDESGSITKKEAVRACRRSSVITTL